MLGPSPEIPDDRLEALRRAFDATLKDPGFIEQTEAHKLDTSLMRAGEVKAFIDRLAQTPLAIREGVGDAKQT